MNPKLSDLTEKGRKELSDSEVENGDVKGQELFWNTRLPGDGTLKNYEGISD